MSRTTTDRTRRLMALATRPEGVTAYEADPDDVGEMTKAFKRMTKAGYGRWEQQGFRLVRYWLTAEEHLAWLDSKTPKNPPRVRQPKSVTFAAISSKTWPTKPVAPRSVAWWDKSARPHHDTYVEPRITSDTKVTICPPRTPEEWLHANPA